MHGPPRAARRRSARLSPRRSLLAAGLLVLAGCSGAPSRESLPRGDARPPIVLVTVESTRADHVGAYGYAHATTPSLDALSREATLFTEAYAVTSWTLPAHASLFTGLYPGAHRVVDYRSRLASAYTTLAELLHEAGYQTVGLVSGPFLRRLYGLDQGFEIYDDSVANPQGNQAAHADVTGPAMKRLVERFFREQRDPARPLFLFVYLWDPHYDYIPPPPCDTAFVTPEMEPVELRGYETNPRIGPDLPEAQRRYVIAQYDGEILCTDAWLEGLWTQLREAGLWTRAVVAVTADHGEEFFEHGFKGHRNNLYEPAVRVPLLLRVPGRPAAVDRRLASQVDLFPTLAALAGLRQLPPHHGASLLEPADPERPVFLELKSEWWVRDGRTGERGLYTDLWFGVRRGAAKYLIERNERRRELYDLSQDPAETVNLAAQRGGTLAELDGLLGEHLKRLQQEAARLGASEPAPLDPALEERLRSLGYVGRERPGEKRPPR